MEGRLQPLTTYIKVDNVPLIGTYRIRDKRRFQDLPQDHRPGPHRPDQNPDKALPPLSWGYPRLTPRSSRIKPLNLRQFACPCLGRRSRSLACVRATFSLNMGTCASLVFLPSYRLCARFEPIAMDGQRRILRRNVKQAWDSDSRTNGQSASS